MDIDIRLPIGALFTAIGLLLAGEGVLGHPKTLAGAAATLNIDLLWGAAMAAFGLLMLALTAWTRRRRRSP